MTTDEAARLHLYDQARSAFGDAAATTLMSVLPRELDHLATKDDLRVVEANLRGEIRAANSELLRTLFFAMVASNATLVGLVFAAVRLG
jgi:hypothetical protein